ncbi:hypothetical protein RAA17_07500 [Komagataeibacter rhaeticus]|nr:hypothetical protein [Komagataeibacter rhaeticus]
MCLPVITGLLPATAGAREDIRLSTWNLEWLTTRPQGDPALPADVTPRTVVELEHLAAYARRLAPILRRWRRWTARRLPPGCSLPRPIAFSLPMTRSCRRWPWPCAQGLRSRGMLMSRRWMSMRLTPPPPARGSGCQYRHRGRQPAGPCCASQGRVPRFGTGQPQTRLPDAATPDCHCRGLDS